MSCFSRYETPAHDPTQPLPYLNPQAPKGGQLRLSTVGSYDSLNPHIIKGTVAEGILFLIFDPLMRRVSDEPFSVYGVIAEKIEVAPDLSWVIFYLHPKAQFHDGTPITAEDVQFSYELLRDYGLPHYKQHYGKIERFEILHSRAIKLYLKRSANNQYDPELPLTLSLLRPLSKRHTQHLDFTHSHLTPLMGSGPYRIKHADQGHSIVYERVSDYWAKDLPIHQGMFNFDQIQVDYYKNAEAQFQNFGAGAFDIYFAQDLSEWAKVKTLNGSKSGEISYVQIEHQRPVTVRTIAFNMKRPLFQDINLRRALLYAFDFDTFNKLLFKKAFKRAKSLFANTPLAHQGPATETEKEFLQPYINQLPDNILEHSFQPPSTKGDGNQRDNLQIADRLLKEAGWVVNDKGIRVNNKGEPLKFEFMIKDPKLEKIVLAFRRSLKQLGIELIIKMMDSVQYENRVIERNFDMIVHSWTNSLLPGHEQVYYFSMKMADQTGSSNYIGLKDPVIEALSYNVVEAKNYPTLLAAVKALDRAVMYQVYMIPLFYDNSLRYAFWKNRLAFPEFSPTAGMNVMEWGWALNPPIEKSLSFFAKVQTFFKKMTDKE
ncbi:MAG: ABC transporter substrate-binding protein [Proteobacteria bacterium]|nr:ABC transporter substrate-binding protein [Pseudomonadota bacterium]